MDKMDRREDKLWVSTVKLKQNKVSNYFKKIIMAKTVVNSTYLSKPKFKANIRSYNLLQPEIPKAFRYYYRTT